MTAFHNSKRDSFLNRIPTANLEDTNDTLTKRCKFNFSYMDFSQKAGQRFGEWIPKKLEQLMEKLYQYTKEPLRYWEKQRIGKGSGHVLEVYVAFPRRSDFIHPKNVPHQVSWARFRLESDDRLIGFVIPKELEGQTHCGTGLQFDCNTFYVVFLDKDHRFYKSKK